MTLNPITWLSRRIAGEVRSHMANPPDWFVAWNDGGVTATAGSGVVVNEYTALNFSAVYQAVRIISEAVASLPLPVYERAEPRGKNRVRDNPIYTLLDEQPNEEMPAYAFRETVTANTLLWGNGYAEIERTAGGDPVGLYPIHSSRVRPMRINAGLVYEVHNPSGPVVTIPAQNMLHIRGLGSDGITGYSVVRFARECFGLGIAAERFGARLFGNGAHAGGWVKTKKQALPAGKQNLRESINAVHQGVDKAHNIGILPEDMDWVSTSINPDDAQFLETRKFQVTEVARWFNLPPHKLADLERSTNNNIEQQSIDFVTHSLRPWLVRWEEEIKVKLLPEPELFAEHLVDGLLRGDSAARSTYYREQFNIGALSQNDIREMENRNPIEGGDRYYVPMNMVPADKVDEVLEKQNAAPSKPEKPADETKPEDDSARSAHLPAFTEAVSRCVRRETECLRRAAKRPETFALYVAKFYVEHEEYVRSALQAPLAAFIGTVSECRSLSAESLAQEMARAHADESKNAILEALKDAENSQIPAKIEPVLVSWEARKASDLASKLTKTTGKTP
jgi:HK97 family phage portal protein